MKRVHIIISGRVQGVGFRNWIYNLSLSYNIKGWIKNLEHNKIEAVFEGKEDDVNRMIKFCEKGPLFAKVDDIKVKKEKILGERNFKII